MQKLHIPSSDDNLLNWVIEVFVMCLDTSVFQKEYCINSWKLSSICWEIKPGAYLSWTQKREKKFKLVRDQYDSKATFI